MKIVLIWAAIAAILLIANHAAHKSARIPEIDDQE